MAKLSSTHIYGDLMVDGAIIENGQLLSSKYAAASHGTHLTLGTGSGNAFRGDYGNTAYNHSQSAHAPSNAQKNSDITKAEIEAKLTGAVTSHTHSYAPSSHNHTSLTGVTSLTFAANSDDSSIIKITKDSATSYTDFIMSDDAGSDMWRWRFKAWDSAASGTTAEYNLMTLKATSTTKGQLSINGNVTADSFTENGTALSSKYAAASHGTHLTLGTGSGNAYRGDYGNKAYTHSQAAHAPSNAQKNSDITKAEIEAKLTGAITSHTHAYAPTSHASTATTYGVSSASNYGHAMASGTTPKANGTAAVGSETAKFARGDHVHPAQTTVSGNAGSATKLATARTINGTSFDGTANITTANWGTTRKINQISVNGSADIKLPLDHYNCSVSNDNTKLYHHILSTGQVTGSWEDKSILIVIDGHYNGSGFGIARAILRSNDAASGATASGEIKWLVRSGFSENQLCYNIRNTAKDTYMDVFYKSGGTYASVTWYILSEGRRGSHGSQWTKNNTNASGTNAYTEAAMKALRSYTSTLVSAVDAGHVKTSSTSNTCSGNAATATKLATTRAIKIGNKSLNFDGSAAITYTLADIGALPIAGGTATGDIYTNQYLGINAWSGYGTGNVKMWFDGTNKILDIDGATDINLDSYKVYHTGNPQPTVAKLSTARTLTIGATGKTFDGSSNVSWSLQDIMKGQGLNASTASNTLYYNNAGKDHVGRLSCYNDANGDFVQVAIYNKSSSSVVSSLNMYANHARFNRYVIFNEYVRPNSNGSIDMGASNYRWRTVYSANGVSTTSDRTLKENIKYVRTGETEINYNDMYNFVKNDLELATYNYINSEERHINFIAQDLLANEDGTDNKVGQFIINPVPVPAKEDIENGEPYPLLSYNTNIYTSVLAGALKESIDKIEELESEKAKMQSEIDELKADLTELKAIVKGLL